MRSGSCRLCGRRMPQDEPTPSSRDFWEQLYGHPLTDEDLAEIHHNLAQFLLTLHQWQENPSPQSPAEATPRPAAGEGRAGAARQDPLTRREKGVTLLTELYAKGVSFDQASASNDSHQTHRRTAQARTNTRCRRRHGHATLGYKTYRKGHRKGGLQ